MTHERQDYGFDYSDNDDAGDSGSADVENVYYTAKCAPPDLEYVEMLTRMQRRKKTIQSKH